MRFQGHHLSHSLLLAAPLALLAGSLQAQSAAPAQRRLRLIPPTNLPAMHFVVDATTGRVESPSTPLPFGGVQTQASGCFANDVTYGYTSLSNNPGEEYVDWGVKSCGLTGVVEGLTMAYQSFNVDPSQGGPGASFSIAVYSGTTGFGVLGQEMRRVTFTNLPTMGGGTMYMTLDFRADPICLPDGPIGWGFRDDDGDTAVLIGVAPQPALGILDALDVYSGPAPTGVYTGTYNFGPGSPYGTMVFTLFENDGSQKASATVVNGSGTNPVAFQQVTPAVIGKTWVTSIDLSTIPTTAATVVLISPASIPPLQTPFGELLIDLGISTQRSFALGTHFLPIPKNLAFVGTTFHAQGALVERLYLPVGFHLTNGLDVTIGF